MKTFHCTACQALVFFENTKCLTCGHVLAFSPTRMMMVALRPDDEGAWRPVENLAANGADGQRGQTVENGGDAPVNSGDAPVTDGDTPKDEVYRLCANYVDSAVCNWAIPRDDPATLCRSCGLTHTIPDQSVPGSLEAWIKLETAKRRLLYTVLSLDLPLVSKVEDARQGLEFRFLADSVTVNSDRSRVLTGHDNGVITINVAEADDVYREAQRLRQHEPYRTLLGHFRHETGHYYWDQLIANSDRLEEFRTLFGDERQDYQMALTKHYEQGAPANWEDGFISAYATTHPWEDWAESWAHVMHMVDALETAQAVGLSVNPERRDEPALALPGKPPLARIEDFDSLVTDWTALTYVLNNLTRGLGLADAYPFVLSTPVIDKLRFVCASMS